MRPTTPKILIEKRLRRYLNEFLVVEILDKKIKTDYTILNLKYGKVDYQTYRFKTNSGNSYDLDFYPYVEDLYNFHIKGSEESILDYLKTSNYNRYEKTVSLGFTLTDVKDLEVDDDIYGTLDDPYIKRTDKNEQYELLSRIAFLIEIFIKNNPDIKIISIDKDNTHENNMKIYLHIFKNLFSDLFKMIETENTLFFVKK